MGYSRGSSEGSILFYSGGHNHNGESSALIAVEAYSIYDFIVGFAGSNERQIKQQTNFNNLKTVISNVIKTDVLGPSGVRLLPNSVQSIHISAGSITADELSANIVLVNNIISSNNYVTGVSGWAINSNGTAEFANTSIRGAIVAASLETTGIDISASGNLTAANFALYANGQIQNGNFSVSPAGVLTATGATISGTVTASSLQTTGIDIDSAGNLTAANFALYANGMLYGSGGNFQVSAAGNLTAQNASISGQIDASSGSVGNWDIGAGNIISSNGKISLINDAGDTVIIAQSAVGTFAAINGDGSIELQNGAAGASQSMNGASYVVTDSIGRTTTVQGSGVYGNLGYVGVNGIDSSGPVYTGASYLSSGAIYSTNTIQAASAVLTEYFIMSGTIAGFGSDLIVRSDGYILINASKRELKTNIEDIGDSLVKIAALRPRVFNWKPQLDDPDDIIHREIKTNHKTMGFVVEEVAETSPEYLQYRIAKDGTLDGHYWKPHDFIALAIQGIKDLSAKVTSLEQRISQLEG